MHFRAMFNKTYLICSLLFLTLIACEPPVFQAANNDEQDVSNLSQDAENNNSSILTDTSTIDDTNIPNPPQPKATITSAPDPFSHKKSAEFTFVCDLDDCTFECSMNGPFSDCTSPITYKNLNDATHTFIVRAHHLGESSPETQHIWTVDTTPPTTTILTSPPAHTNSKTANFTFECNEPNCTFECSIDQNTSEPCTSPKSYTNLPDGPHKITVHAIDQAQNIGPPTTKTWTVDTTPPTTTILTKPDTSTYYSTATFTFECNEPDCTFECSVDNRATFQPCTSPKTYENLDRKLQKFAVRSIDRAQNTGPSTNHNWTVTWPKWTQIAVGTDHACGLIEDGTIWCWGNSTLAHPTITESEVPIQVETASDWQYIAAGGFQSCGIRNGRLYCWGHGTTGGDPEPDSQLRSYAGTDWSSVTPGPIWHNCGIRGTTNQLWCWGNNTNGQLGTGTTRSETNPVKIASSFQWKMVSLGQFHTCGTTTNGWAWCWGNNRKNQLPTPDSSTRQTTPQLFTALYDFYENAWAIGDHTFIDISLSGQPSPQARGHNSHGQLGLGHYNNITGLSVAPSPNGITDLVGGDAFSCGRYGTKIYCSGKNDIGQLGRAKFSPSENTFQPISAPGISFTQLDASSNSFSSTKGSVCARDTNHNIWCWGSITNSHTPTKIPWPY